MRINSNKFLNKIESLNFKGFEARKLQGIITNGCYGDEKLIKELEEIAKQNGLILYNSSSAVLPWVQDRTFINSKGKVFGSDLPACEFSKFKGLDTEGTNLTFYDGGNYFQVKNKNGETLLLSGAVNFLPDDICEVGSGFHHGKFDKDFCCDRIVKVPQADFHLDLFLTPIGDNKILLCDDDLTIQYIEKMLQNAKKYLSDEKGKQILKSRLKILSEELEGFLQQFKINKYILDSAIRNKSNDSLSSLSDVEKVLKDEGFEVIKVPARIYSYGYNAGGYSLSHDLNYANAVTFKNNENEVVILTNKSRLNRQFGITPEISDILGTDFEKMFLDSVDGYVKPENIFFLEGRRLPEELKNSKGGLHCISLEIPDFSSDI